MKECPHCGRKLFLKYDYTGQEAYWFCPNCGWLEDEP